MEENAGTIPIPARYRCLGNLIPNSVQKSNLSVWASADNQAISFFQLREPCNSTSKTSSSEDSEADQYSVYSLGRPFSSFS